MQTVHVRVNDAATGQPTPVRIRFTNAAGEYFAPFGRLTEFTTALHKDVGGNALLGSPINPQVESKKYAYIDGTCEIRLPPGPLLVEIAKGPEYTPLCQRVQLRPGQLSLRLAIGRWVDLRTEYWYSGDTGVFCIPPHAALLEAAAEDVAVVNLLAFERYTSLDGHSTKQPAAIPNILAFSGQRPALEMPGHLVAVNTSNTSKLGCLSLLNCHRVVYPLSFGNRAGFDNWSMGDWCDQCHRKGGLVVWSELWSYSPGAPIGEPLAHLLLGKVDALETAGFGGPADAEVEAWYWLLNCGYRVPLVGASYKSSNSTVLGSVRTYARVASGEELSYRNWIEAVRAGRVFVTNGPLLSLTVDGQAPGAVLNLPAGVTTVRVRAEAHSMVPFQRLEVVANGEVVAGGDASGTPAGAALEMDYPVSASCWIAARCYGNTVLYGSVCPEQSVFAHAAPIYVEVAGRPLRPDPNAVTSILAELDRLLPWAEGEGTFANEGQRQHFASIVQGAREELLRRLPTS